MIASEESGMKDKAKCARWNREIVGAVVGAIIADAKTSRTAGLTMSSRLQ